MLEHLILWGLVLFAILLVVCECWKFYLSSTKNKNLTVLKGLPILGHFVEFMKCDNVQILDFYNRRKVRHDVNENCRGAIMWMGPTILFMFTDHPDTYELVLNSEKSIKKSYVYNFIRNTRGVFTSEPMTWKKYRKVLYPTLGPKMVSRSVPIFYEKSQKMVELMQRHVGQCVDMYEIMFRTAIDTVFDASFGVNWPMQNATSDKLRDAIVNAFDRVQSRVHSVRMHSNLLYKMTKLYQLDNQDYSVVNRIIEGIVEAKKCDLAEKLEHGINELADLKETNTSNVLEKCLQLELEQKFNDKDIHDEVQTMMFASADTTAIIIHATTLMLAIHQHYQNQVFEELRSILTNVDERITNEHLQQMKFIELVIKESMRLFPVAAYIARENTEDLPMDGGIIPKGTQIIMNILSSNRNPKYWGEHADEFYPERFLPEHSANYHPYQYIPFSAGPRNCIGMRYAWASLQIAIACILRRYRLTTDLKMQDLSIRASIIMKIMNKNPVRIETREW